jgi:hypothetical protein
MRRFGRVVFSTVALAALAIPAAAQARRAPPPASARTPKATPAPTPAPAPTPTPVSVTVVAQSTQAPLVMSTDTALDHLTQTQSFAAYQSTVKQEYAASGANAGKPQYYTNFARVTAQIQYNAATHSYIVRDTGNVNATSSFGPGNVVGAESNASYTVYRKTGGGSTETLTLLNPGASNPTIALTYASFGHWRKVTPGGGNFGNTAQSDTYFVYGFKTPKGSVPTSGTATYTTLLDGTYIDPDRSYDIDGAGTVTANFAGNTLAFSAAANGTPATGPGIHFGTINGSGTINSNASSFMANGSNATYRMNVAGYFFGPTANEVGGVFQITGPRGNGNGAMVGAQP